MLWMNFLGEKSFVLPMTHIGIKPKGTSYTKMFWIRDARKQRKENAHFVPRKAER